MSTAIALQDLQTTDGPETSTLRYRQVTKPTYDNPAVADEVRGTWALTSQDTSISKTPLEYQRFVPTNVYWIIPHGLLSKDIKILDLTKDISTPFTTMSAAYKNEITKALKDHNFTPVFSLKKEHWAGLKHRIEDDQGTTIAQWVHPWTSVRTATLSFPPSSPHASHPISLNNKHWGWRTECFVVDSVPFSWEMDSMWHSTNMTLFKIYGSGEGTRKTEVGKYAQKGWGSFVTGGTLVVDEREIDGLVACLTLCVVLKKKRQRAAERKEGG